MAIFLFLPTMCFSSTIIQIKDFLCGCDYCVTVQTGEPLDIASHLSLCSSTREGMLKTIQIMNQTKKPKIKESKGKQIIKEGLNPIGNRKKDTEDARYEWIEDQYGTWKYLNNYYIDNTIDSWVYREDLGWLWSFDANRFFYSQKYGWLYNYSLNNRRFFYWYDRRRWVLPKNIFENK